MCWLSFQNPQFMIISSVHDKRKWSQFRELHSIINSTHDQLVTQTNTVLTEYMSAGLWQDISPCTVQFCGEDASLKSIQRHSCGLFLCSSSER